jgi:hypothetical protein
VTRKEARRLGRFVGEWMPHFLDKSMRACLALDIDRKIFLDMPHYGDDEKLTVKGEYWEAYERNRPREGEQ